MIDRAVVDKVRSGTKVLSPELRAAVVPTLAVAVLGFAWLWLVLQGPGFADTDAEAYYNLDYSGTIGERTFLYSPVVYQVLLPFTTLPYEAFYALLAAVNLGALWYLVGPWAAPALLIPHVNRELATGNIHLLLAASIVLALRQPGWWAFPLLTKVTPAIGGTWHLLRGEWRAAVEPAIGTVLICAISAVLAPELWVTWFGILLEAPTDYASSSVGLAWSLWIRLPIALGLVVLAARLDRPALIPVASMLALPVVWAQSFVMLLAVVPLSRGRAPR
jgi:hypothetical protein